MSTVSRIALFVLLISVQSWLIQAQEVVDPYADMPMSRTDDGGFVLGDPAASVKLIEFSDFLCTSCQNYEPIVTSFIWDYVFTGQAQFEYRIFPVIDPELSVLSASLVECADTLQPGSFWRAHDRMFDQASKHGFTAASYIDFAESLELDPQSLSQCAIDAEQHIADAAYGISLGVSGTPSLFVQYGDSAPVPIALALAEHYPAIVNAARPQAMEPVTIPFGIYTGLTTFRRADGGFVLGDPDAPLTIVAFEDFLCPHCQLYTETVHQFVDAYVRTGKTQFEFRFYPLVNPQYSTTAAKTAECVAAQDLGLFWDAHDLLFQFAMTGNLADMGANLASLLSLDAEALDDCLDQSVQFLIDTQLGQSAGVSGTPAIRARDSEDKLQVIYAGQQPQDRGGLSLDLLGALVEGAPSVSIGEPELSLLNDIYLQDSSLITGEPCGPPCWQNITPGQTSLSEAVAIVTAIDGLEIVQSGESAFVFRQDAGAACCQVVSRAGETISTILLQIAPITTIGEVIAIQGEPQYVTGQPFSETEAVIMLYYPEQNMLLSAMVPGQDGQLEKSSPVVTVVYATDEIFSEAFGSMPFDTWKGYLKYSEYMDGEFDYHP